MKASELAEALRRKQVTTMTDSQWRSWAVSQVAQIAMTNQGMTASDIVSLVQFFYRFASGNDGTNEKTTAD